MDFALTEDQQQLRKSAREFLEAEAPLSLARRMLEDPTGYDDALWNHMAELGWMGLAIAEGDGGLGLGLLELALLLEEMGRVVAPSPLFSTVALAVPVIAAVEQDPARRKAILEPVAAGERKLTLAIAEASARFDAAQTFSTTANGGTVTGRKLFVPDAHVADQIVVVTAGGVFLVEAADCTITPHESLDRSRRLADVTFDGVNGTRLGDGPDVSVAVGAALDRAAVALAAEATGVASAVLEQTVSYARERTQFGRAIGSFQAISHKCADMLVRVESARSTTYYAAWGLDESTPDAALAAATAKSCASTGAVSVCEDGIQIHGGIGFTWEHDMHIYLRRAKFTELFLGSASVWRDRIVSLL